MRAGAGRLRGLLSVLRHGLLGCKENRRCVPGQTHRSVRRLRQIHAASGWTRAAQGTRRAQADGRPPRADHPHWYGRCERRPQPAGARDTHQYRPAMEPHQARTAQGAHPAHRAEAGVGEDPQSAVQGFGRGPGAPGACWPPAGNLPALRPDSRRAGRDVWIDVALGEVEKARQELDRLPVHNPFDERYGKIQSIADWETCTQVLNRHEKLELLRKGV